MAQTKEMLSKQAVQTKEIISKQAVKIAKQAEEHERFINKVWLALYCRNDSIVLFWCYWISIYRHRENDSFLIVSIPFLLESYFARVFLLIFRSRTWSEFLVSEDFASC